VPQGKHGCRRYQSWCGLRFVVLGVCVAVSTLLPGCRERREYFCATLGDAVKAGEIDRGWIPDYLPASSHSIHLSYSAASPRTWCAFEFSPGDARDFRARLTSVGVLTPRLRHVDGPGAAWWPDFLTGDLDLAKIQANGFGGYVVEERGVQNGTDLVLFVIDWGKGKAFFHRTAGG
jgi:hypothetical protein